MVLARFLTTPNAVSATGDAPTTSTAIRLRAPYPNPLVRRSAIAFEVLRSGPVQLSLHDVTGRLVLTLADEVLAAGSHEFAWDGTDGRGHRVAAGMYFVHLKAGSERARATIGVLH